MLAFLWHPRRFPKKPRNEEMDDSALRKKEEH
jgi:hypothetical protein